MGIDPHSLGIRTLGSHLGQEDRARIEELWNAPCHDAYGTHESGMMAAECGERAGMHIQEDAVILEIADTDTGAAAARRREGRRVHHDALSLGRAADPLQHQRRLAHHSRAVPVRRHAEAARPHLRPQRHDGEAARRQRVPRGGRRGRRRRCAQQRRVRVHRRAHRRRGSRGDDGADRGRRPGHRSRRASRATSSSASRRCSACASSSSPWTAARPTATPARRRPRRSSGWSIGAIGLPDAINSPFRQLQLADLVAMHFVGPVGEAQRRACAYAVREAEVVADAGAAVRLDRPVDHLAAPSSAPRP